MANIYGTNFSDFIVGPIDDEFMFGGPAFGPGFVLGLGNDTLGRLLAVTTHLSAGSATTY